MIYERLELAAEGVAWFPGIDCPLSVGNLPFENLAPMSPWGRLPTTRKQKFVYCQWLLLSCIFARKNTLVEWWQDKESLGYQAGRQHYFIDVAMFGPGQGPSMFGGAPERLNPFANGHVLHQLTQL